MFGRCQCTAPTRREADACRPDDLVRPPPLFDDSLSIITDRVTPTTTNGEEEEKEEETGKRYELIQINIRINAIIKIPKLPSSFLLFQGVEIAWLKGNETRSTSATFLPTDSINSDGDDAIVVEAANETGVTNDAWVSSGKERERERKRKNRDRWKIIFRSIVAVQDGSRSGRGKHRAIATVLTGQLGPRLRLRSRVSIGRSPFQMHRSSMRVRISRERE